MAESTNACTSSDDHNFILFNSDEAVFLEQRISLSHSFKVCRPTPLTATGKMELASLGLPISEDIDA